MNTSDSSMNAGHQQRSVEHSADTTSDWDVVIVGGGAAGLWLLNLLNARGYRAVLCEQTTLGGAQSMASQGMIHGGIKYALGAALTGASEAIARMPERWRSCISGNGEIDLRQVQVVANEYHMWSNGALGKLGSFFASHALRGRVEALAPAAYPDVFKNTQFDGTVHKLHDLVLDVASLLQVLAAPQQNRLIAGQAISANFDESANMQSLTLADGRELRANQFVFAAGAGNSVFCDALKQAGHSHAPATQLRPLHQVFVQHAHLSPLFAHCITGIRRAEPRLTITTHPTPGGGLGWYIGGHLATSGVQRDRDIQIDVTRQELNATLPWIDWNRAEISTLRIDRAEPRQTLGAKPDEACVVRCGNALLCWPTKLSLVPDLGDQVLNAIDPAVDPSASDSSAEQRDSSVEPGAERPIVATAPWLA